MDYTQNLLQASWVHLSILQNYTLFFCVMNGTFDISAPNIQIWLLMEFTFQNGLMF